MSPARLECARGAVVLSHTFAAPKTELFLSLWQAQSGKCALCEKPMLKNRFEAPHARIWAKQRATFDHIIPRSKGGQDEADNFQLAHARCNKLKGNLIG